MNRALPLPAFFVLSMILLGGPEEVWSAESSPETSPKQEARRAAAAEDLEAEIVELVRSLTLTTIAESQTTALRKLQETFETHTELLQEHPSFPSLSGLMAGLEALLLEDDPARAIPFLEAVAAAPSKEPFEALSLVLLGVAHHRYQGRGDDGHQRPTGLSEEYFRRAERLPLRLGLASNGLAAQWGYQGFQNLKAGNADEALSLLRKAEDRFARAADLDGTRAASYRYFNNRMYIREQLLVSHLDGRLGEERLLVYGELSSMDDFIAFLDESLAQVKRFAFPGSWAPEKASAECLSITGEFFEAKGNLEEARRRYGLAKAAYIDSLASGSQEGQGPEEIRLYLEGSRLLRGLVRHPGALKDILAHVAP